MALGWEMVILFAGFSAALENTQALSQKCLMDTNTFLWDVKQARPKEYAVQMYDSYGKLGSNMKGGNVNQAGTLQQCHSAHAATFSGQYCQVFLRQETVDYFVAICVPDTCSQEEVETLVLHGKLQIDQRSLIPPLPYILVNDSTQEMFTTDCLFKPSVPDASAITCLFVCCLMVAIPLAATLHTAILRWQRNKEVSPTAESLCLNSSLNLYGTLKNKGSSTNEINADTLGECGEDGSSQCPRCSPRRSLSHFLHAFSLQTTSQGVFSTSSSLSGKTYSSLNGIRVLSLFWIISGHVGHFLSLNNLDNLGSWKETFRSNPVYMLSMTGPVFLAVDTFLLLGGLLAAKSLLGVIRGAEDKMSIPLVAKYLLNRMKRIQPLHMFILCLTTGPLSMVPRGPFSRPFTHLYHDCKDSWWANILLISNFFQISDMCIPWAWYLSLDFQCYLTTPLIVMLYRLYVLPPEEKMTIQISNVWSWQNLWLSTSCENKTVFAVVSGFLLLTTMVISTVVTALMVLPVFMPAVVQSEAYGHYYYGPLYTRYGSFLIGMVAGIFLTMKTDRWLKKKWQATIGWILCMTLLATVSILPYILGETPLHPSAPHALYSGTHRSLWALALTWIIVACEEGYGGFVNRFLSWGFWTPLSNISFASYLVHPLVIILHLCLQDNSISYSDINFLHLFLGNLAITLLVSLPLHMLIERPYILLKCGCP